MCTLNVSANFFSTSLFIIFPLEKIRQSVKNLDVLTYFDNVLKYLLPFNSLSGQQWLQSEMTAKALKQITVCGGNIAFFSLTLSKHISQYKWKGENTGVFKGLLHKWIYLKKAQTVLQTSVKWGEFLWRSPQWKHFKRKNIPLRHFEVKMKGKRWTRQSKYM